MLEVLEMWAAVATVVAAWALAERRYYQRAAIGLMLLLEEGADEEESDGV